jgi:hypothetical protein
MVIADESLHPTACEILAGNSWPGSQGDSGSVTQRVLMAKFGRFLRPECTFGATKLSGDPATGAGAPDTDDDLPPF